MRKGLLILAVLFVPLMGFAQVPVSDPDWDCGARVGFTVDKKLMKGLHLTADGQVRMVDNFASVGRWDAGLGLSYKINKTFKVGGGYQFIHKANTAGEWIPRHRFYVDGTASVHFGYWHIALKEKFQLTHREFKNTYENNPNNLTLKSRLKVSYKGLENWTPYGYVEVRNVFNDPTCSAVWNSAIGTYSDYSFTGYNDAYVNRVRGVIGTEWKINKQNALDFYLLGEYTYDKCLDVDKDGPTLKSIYYSQHIHCAICVGYVFSF